MRETLVHLLGLVDRNYSTLLEPRGNFELFVLEENILSTKSTSKSMSCSPANIIMDINHQSLLSFAIPKGSIKTGASPLIYNRLEMQFERLTT